MDGTGKAWAAGEDAMAAIAPESGLFAQLDPVSFGESLLAVARRAARNPYAAYGAFWRYASVMARIGPEAFVHWAGLNGDGQQAQALAKDKRFADPAWEENPAFYALRQAYLAGAGSSPRTCSRRARATR